MKITFITVSAPAVKELIKVGNNIEKNYPSRLDLCIYYAASNINQVELNAMEKDIIESDLIFIDLMGTSPYISNKVEAALKESTGDIVPYGGFGRQYLKLGKFNAESMKKKDAEKPKKIDMSKMTKMMDMSEKMGKIIPGRIHDMRNYSLINKYFLLADYDNILNMIYLILRDYGGYKEIPNPEDPKDIKDISICDPINMKYYKDYQELDRYYPLDLKKPFIAILYYGHMYPTDTSKCISEIRDRLSEFANVIPIAVSNTYRDEEEILESILIKQAPKEIDLVLNFMSFRLGAGPMGGNAQAGVDLLKDIDAPYLHPFFMSRRKKSEWMESVQGASTSEVMISVMLPELDGALETFPIGVMGEPYYDEDYKVNINELILIDDRVDRLVNKCKNYIKLRNKPNKEKRIAIIGYNYPPGESNLFGGAFLDSFSSLENILKRLKEEGYETSGMSKQDLKKVFTAGKLVNSGKYGDYSQDLIRYADKNYKEDLFNFKDYKDLKSRWGKSPGDIMSEYSNFLIPGHIDGNIFVGLQPSKGLENIEEDYHDKTIPPHHQYIAYYKWLREEFKADAIIHLGTHGTLEFLKGKECGMSQDCYPDILLGDIPHIYLYYCGNPSEAIVAKRRSNANIVSYHGPVFLPGDLYGDYSKLMTDIDNYRQSLSISPGTSKLILEDIINRARELNLPETIDEIEKELYKMKTSLIPQGLHIIGEAYNKNESLKYAKGLLRYKLGDGRSLRDALAKSKDWDLSTLEKENKMDKISKIDSYADEIFKEYVDTGDIDKYNLTNHSKKEIMNILDYGLKSAKRTRENFELEGIVRTLNARYNPVELSGDIYRNPKIFPTGYNLYQFDPRLIPTQSAYRRGKEICNETLDAYYKEEGDYPRSTAVILWGIETSRTQGESLSQILSYLGIRVIDTGVNWEPRYEIIPLEELGRPRVDVTINICGFFRDMFPNLILNISDILEDLYNLDEPDHMNYFKSNSKKIYKYLIDQGYDKEEAKNLSISRIFGPESGSYGSSVTDIIESQNWKDENEIGTIFLDNLQYVYSRNYHGKKVDNLYKENLKTIDIVSQIRSSNEYEITDLDHYYEFFGGLSKSVEMVRGKKAKMYITDVTRDKIESESIEKSINRGVRTRILNPKWIDGLLEHDYHGVQTMSDRFENIMGLAATTGEVEEWIYDDLHNKYVEDENLRKRLIENNKYAYMDILDRMMEYNIRGYWKASEEQISKIKEIYLDLEDKIEESL